jgi:16S rRNA G966 N2-methylase RsmD
MRKIILGDNSTVLPTLPSKLARLVYIDPPFSTGHSRKRDRMRPGGRHTKWARWATVRKAVRIAAARLSRFEPELVGFAL